MKTQETKVKVLAKETKTGNSNGQDWTINEYTLLEHFESESGTVTETKVKATASKTVGDLKVNGIYNVVMFISSRETEKDGKKSIWNSFRITRAEILKEPSAQEEVTVEDLDECPF